MIVLKLSCNFEVNRDDPQLFELSMQSFHFQFICLHSRCEVLVIVSRKRFDYHNPSLKEEASEALVVLETVYDS